MDNKEALNAIRENIKEEKFDVAGPQIMALASENQGDPMTLLTCASMLRTIGNDADFPGILDVIMSHLPSDPAMRYEVGQGLISLGCLKEAGQALADLEPSDKVRRARAAVFYGTGRDNDALSELGAMEKMLEIDRVLKVQVLGSMGKHDKAIAEADEIQKLFGTYRSNRAYVSALVLAGRSKDAAKFAKEKMKAKDADGYALMAYFQWLNGNSTAAGAFSSKALAQDNNHIGALETIGYSFADKGSFWEARIAAGAINEKEPGNPAAFRVLAMCRGRE
ncbi:hypothetical protein TALC_01026 [Thermoplasmatales archaeon BRNA1]|nr:hypothetical protein TALC_01026 [Thermoplasmatales archaeon BRNA1]